MGNRFLIHGFSVFAALFLAVVPAAASVDPPYIVTSSRGDFFVVDGSRRYALQPYRVNDSDLASLNVWYVPNATVPIHPAREVQAVVSSDGSIYLVQGGSAWLPNPDAMSESALAALSYGGELVGTIPVPALPLQSRTPPPELVGKWGMTDSGAGPGSWFGDSYRFKTDGSFEHAGRFVYGVDMQQYQTGTIQIDATRLRLDASFCEIKRSQFEQAQPCVLETEIFGWRVGKNEVGNRVLILTALDGSQTELRPMAS